MIKQISKNNLVVSPFTAIKAWELYNVENEDLVLLEPMSGSSSIPDTSVALDYIDYSGSPLLNRDCNIALEQQESDTAIYEEGISGSGLFIPDYEDQNDNGSYKRLVYDQMSQAFYNVYQNPLQIFGMENIDFPLSKTNRYLANQFVLFSIPRKMMGDRLLEGSIQMFDNSLDDNVEIHDDALGNLNAGKNLFSKVQEIRHIGNILREGFAIGNCPSYTNIILQSGILWMQANDGNYYQLQCVTDGITTTIVISQLPSSPPFFGTPYVIFLSNDGNLYKWSLFIDDGIVNYEITRMVGVNPYVLSISLISNDLTYHDIIMETTGLTTSISID